MQYRKLGATGLTVSQLGFGAMRLPMVGDGEDSRVDRALAIPLIHHAFEQGVNYIDTAVGYCNQDSQRVVGEALKGWRNRIIVSTKNPYFGSVRGVYLTEKEWWQNLEDSLERLQVEYIDIYNIHGVNWRSFEEFIAPRAWGYLRQARDQGLIRHICCSYHDTNESLIKLVDTGFPEVITLQYNILDRQLEAGIAHAHDHGIGVVVMGPVGGGRLGEPSEVLENLAPGVKHVPELALRFVLANPNVSLALSGMSTLSQLNENLAVASDTTALTEDDLASIDEHLHRLRKMADLYCTGCRYCMPCPTGVDIPHIFDLYNRGRVYGIWKSSRAAYERLTVNAAADRKNAEACVECGECEGKCPQAIPVINQLKEAHEALTKGNS